MKVIFIAGTWGSGTSAVVGALDKMGMQTLGPHFRSNDPRTPNTFELKSFRDVIFQYMDEQTLKPKGNKHKKFIAALRALRKKLEAEPVWSTDLADVEQYLVLKMPLASICLPEIYKVFNARIILVHRPLAEIEASRVRRNWPAYLGGQGANQVYSKMFSDLINHKLSFLGISYADFLNDTRRTLLKIASYCDVSVSPERLDAAESFVRTD